ncbi:hypothetical protein C3Y87_03955 [Carbonactinospora thermoautotrophica]|uniref:Uncharacterized protein n=1 Tax=Carbonactinospora thermoautotrophica TaxID=1469144 RepID=A0A132MY22_9ACTN|nr:hypothetical protein [Carbonactinospora thermoautotrophica]KWX02759.1 hypothetical protein LI90_3805 [Carbonactinospora thermoautotrophica]KWX03798.1 hypothetical protein TH66_13520 [Carbonactinospora thermoautotrophica]MCX9190579.1 hypothetical protein [Carbonactinospora thermoautotrophica]
MATDPVIGGALLGAMLAAGSAQGRKVMGTAAKRTARATGRAARTAARHTGRGVATAGRWAGLKASQVAERRWQARDITPAPLLWRVPRDPDTAKSPPEEERSSPMPAEAKPPGRLVCPECGEPVQQRPPTSPTPWRANGRPVPEYSHLDGEPLCPVMGQHGYEPAQPVPAPDPGDRLAQSPAPTEPAPGGTSQGSPLASTPTTHTRAERSTTTMARRFSINLEPPTTDAEFLATCVDLGDALRSLAEEIQTWAEGLSGLGLPSSVLTPLTAIAEGIGEAAAGAARAASAFADEFEDAREVASRGMKITGRDAA